MTPLRILAILVGAAFLLLLFVGFDNMLGLLRSRVAIFLALSPLIAIFLWSVYRAIRSRKSPRRYIDIESHSDKP